MGSILGPVSDDNVLLYVRITSCSTVMENLVSVAVWYISEVECNFVEICTSDILIIQLLLGVGYCYYSVGFGPKIPVPNTIRLLHGNKRPFTR